MSELLRGNFSVKRNVKKDEVEKVVDLAAEFKKKALESIGGSMVFVEREKLFWDESGDKIKK
jgi:hypothetical protein